MELVHEWLAENEIEREQLDYSPARDWITVRLPVTQIEDLLDTEYSTFVDDDGMEIVRAPVWSLPEHLHTHIETIQPTNSFFRPRPVAKTLKYDAAIDHLPPPPDNATLK